MYHQNQQHHAHHQDSNNQHKSLLPPVICPPSLIRQPTTFESLTSTLQSFSLPTFPSPFRHSNPNLSRNLTSDPSLWLQPSHSNPSFPSQPSHATSSHTFPTHDSDRITFSNWFQLNNRRNLLLINSIGIAIWDAQDLEALVQTCWIRWDHLRPSVQAYKTSSPIDSLDCLITTSNSHFLHNFEPVSGAVLPSMDQSYQAVLVLLFNSLLDRSCKLITIAAHTGQILNLVDLAGIGVQIETNRKAIVIATKSPLALHLYGWEQSSDSTQLSLVKLPCSPILDLAPRPKTTDPVFHLGQTRLLAYASSKPPSERESPIATGHAFSFSVPPHDPHSPSISENKESGFGLNPTLSGARNSSPAGIGGTSWRNSVAPNLDAIDETARKLGGGLLNGAKYLSSWGQNLWNPNMDNINSSRQTFHHTPRNELGIAFSQSAPLPHKISAACPSPHPRYEESHHGSSHGNVQIIDLFGETCSNQNAQSHPYSICHFKISSHPLTFLSLNPSSSLLLTSSIEGHSFHIFELRPSSRVGKSYLNAYRSGHTSFRRQATVWHRYKLTRGFTSAEVIDVAWRWDSKIVSVLTEHGTNHLFAIHPAGGAAGVDPADMSRSPRGGVDPLSSIFGSRIHNPRIPQPLSVTVSAFEKIKHKPLRPHSLQPQHDKAGLAPTLGPVSYLDHMPIEHENLAGITHFRHTSLVFVHPTPEHLSNNSHEDKQQVLLDSHKRLPSVLLYEPSTNSVTLYNFEIKKKLLNSVTNGVSSGLVKSTGTMGTNSDNKQHSSAENKNQTSPSPSGLSQLMQQKKQAGPKDLQTHSSNVFIHSFAPVVWSLSAIQDPMMINTNRFFGSTISNSPCKSRSDSRLSFVSRSTTHGQNWTSFAELDTFSHSLRILPRSIYTSHQFDFYNFTQTRKSSFTSFSNQSHPSFNNSASLIEQLSRADFDHIKKKKVMVKREVQIQPGDLGNQQDPSHLFALSTVEINDNFINPHFGGPPSKEIVGGTTHNQMYAEPIRSAVEAVLDPTLASPQSPINLFPEFPNGRPARTASHGAHQNPLISFKKSLASNVAPVVGVVNDRMRKEFGKIASSAAISEAGRRRISGAGYWNGISESLGQRLTRKPEVYDGGVYVNEGITSVSFEDDQDEAIRIDRSLFDHQGPSSSSMNSFTSTNSLANPNSDELGLESNSRSGQSIMDEDVAEELSERWDGWTFEDDLEIKTQSESKDQASFPLEIQLGDSSRIPKQGPKSDVGEAGWNSSMINPGLMAHLKAIELKEDGDLEEDGGEIETKAGGKSTSPKSPSHLRVKENNKADSDPNSGSRSSSALSTSTSASNSGEDSDKAKAFPSELSSQAATVQKSPPSRLSKNSRSNNKSFHNHKKR